MKRLYEAAAYGPQQGCFWAETVPAIDWPVLQDSTRADVVIIGAGFTGLSAALHLVQAGMDVVVLEAETPGYGASGRNGGFCCLGGSKLSHSAIARQHGPEGARDWARTEVAAIDTVRGILDDHRIDADVHSDGETLLAHNARAFAGLQKHAIEQKTLYGVTPELAGKSDLSGLGIGGDFYGALTLPIGFALNPRKYHAGLAIAAQSAGARLFQSSPCDSIREENGHWICKTAQGQVRADKVLIATNGYSSEDVPDWLAARTMPVQSSIILTHVLSEAEKQAQGWSSSQMCYDTRTMLHYFRMLPDGRFLFGMRGGLTATPREQAKISRKIRENFHRLFPAWSDVPFTHEWSGLLCLTSKLAPYVGPVAGMTGMFAAFGYHGNGVAMGSHSGKLAADLIAGNSTEIPALMAKEPRRFPLGKNRRLLMRPAYLAAELLDL